MHLVLIIYQLIEIKMHLFIVVVVGFQLGLVRFRIGLILRKIGVGLILFFLLNSLLIVKLVVHAKEEILLVYINQLHIQKEFLNKLVKLMHLKILIYQLVLIFKNVKIVVELIIVELSIDIQFGKQFNMDLFKELIR